MHGEGASGKINWRMNDILVEKPWFMLEDTAFIDHNNYFVYQGRADTAIITSAGRVGDC